MATQLQDPDYEIIKVDTDKPLTAARLHNLLSSPEITLLVRSETGDPRRGGYYFQIRKNKDDYTLLPLDRKNDNDSYTVSFDRLLELINHMSGRQFSKDAMLYVRHEIYMRVDD